MTPWDCTPRACLTRGCACVITYGEGNHGRHRHGPAWRDHRSSLATDRAAAARIRPKRRPMERAPNRRQWHPLEVAHRLALARPPGEVRTLADLLRPLQSLEARRP